jgi:hypothetical protein
MEESKKIKQTIDQVLKASVSTVKRTVLKQKRKEEFCEMLALLKYINDRAIVMKNDIGVDFTEFEEPFFTSIETLMKRAFTKKQLTIINWWLYDKWYHPEGTLVLTEETTGREIPTDTPEELYEFIQTI